GLAAALSCAGFMLLAPVEGDARPSDRAAAAAGLLAALGVFFEYQNLIVAGLLLAFAAWKGGARGLAFFAAGAAPVAAALGLYHALCFGRPWAFPYGHLANPEFQSGFHVRGFHGLAL